MVSSNVYFLLFSAWSRRRILLWLNLFTYRSLHLWLIVTLSINWLWFWRATKTDSYFFFIVTAFLCYTLNEKYIFIDPSTMVFFCLCYIKNGVKTNLWQKKNINRTGNSIRERFILITSMLLWLFCVTNTHSAIWLCYSSPKLFVDLSILMRIERGRN